MSHIFYWIFSFSKEICLSENTSSYSTVLDKDSSCLFSESYFSFTAGSKTLMQVSLLLLELVNEHDTLSESFKGNFES